jgi:hypothetical protein
MKFTKVGRKSSSPMRTNEFKSSNVDKIRSRGRGRRRNRDGIGWRRHVRCGINWLIRSGRNFREEVWERINLRCMRNMLRN